MSEKNIDITSPIGVFDSGVGGLTVAREIMHQLPNEKIVYFGDTARVPYGSKSKDTITKYSEQIIRFLKTKNVKAIVVACNTASAYALETVRENIDIPIIGVVKPGAITAVANTKNKRVGVIGTEGTIRSQIYTDFIRELDSSITAIGRACPLFVPLVEEGMLHDAVTDEMANRYLEGLKREDIDTLILGCTHYPLLKSTVGRILGDKVTLVNPAYETAHGLKALLEEANMLNPQENGNVQQMYEYYVSDSANKFRDFADSILPFEIEKIQQINIEEY